MAEADRAIMERMAETKRVGLVLPAGGARAAYQVGVLRYVAEAFPHVEPRVFTGVSAGSINSCFLAQGEPFRASTAELYRLWAQLEFHDVLRTNFKSLFRMFARWAYDLFLSKVTHRLLLRSLLDASPLASTLLGRIYFWKIARAVRSGRIDGLAVSATNYHDGTTTVFFDSTEPITPWRREQRRALRTTIRVRHIMASCSIPILFEPVRIGDFLYGDGALRFSFPFSPAIHLGATHLLAVGTRCLTPENALGIQPENVGMGFIAGAILNSIFHDSLESDFENLSRMNKVQQADGIKQVPAMLVRPSRDLGALARPHLDAVPFHLRQLLRSTAAPAELGDLLSYLMFSPAYVKELLQLGMKDGETHHAELKKLLDA